MRTDAEIRTAISQLRDNRKVCAPCNYFGESNYSSIDIMISVLEKKMTEREVYDKYDSDTHENHRKWRAAITAVQYMRGEWELQDILFPNQ